MTLKLAKNRSAKKKSLQSNKNKKQLNQLIYLPKMLIYDDFNKRCNVIFKSFLILFDSFYAA